MDISMDLSMDISMDIHIHGNPAFLRYVSRRKWQFSTSIHDHISHTVSNTATVMINHQ